MTTFMRSSLQRNLPVMEVKPVNPDGLTTVNEVDREREWLALVPRAMGKSELTRQRYAGHVKVSEPLLCAQLSAVENKHLSFRRMCHLPRPFWQELVLLIIDFYDLQIGLSEVDRRDLETGRALRELVTRSVAR